MTVGLFIGGAVLVIVGLLVLFAYALDKVIAEAIGRGLGW